MTKNQTKELYRIHKVLLNLADNLEDPGQWDSWYKDVALSRVRDALASVKNMRDDT